MSAAYQSLAKREKKIADSIAEDAKEVGMSCLSSSLAAVSQVVVKALLKDDGRGRISEPASDLKDLRTNRTILLAKDADLSKTQRIFTKLLIEAIRYGYEYDANERSKVIVSESTGLQISVELSEQEIADLASFPISGLTAAEWSERARYLLNNAIDQALAKPLTGAVDVAAIPGLFTAAAQTHANSLSSLTKEAFFAGGKAAMLALREALSGH